jgi:ABC-type sugar transport system ATPase subunit
VTREIGEPVLEIGALSKSFQGRRVLSDVSLSIKAGEIHALLGENGSGKSTLIKCLTGYHEPDPGARVAIGGVDLPSPYSSAEAAKRGLAFMHQDLGLIPALSVAENLAIDNGFSTGLGFRIRWSEEHRRAEQLLRLAGHRISPKTMVRRLSPADKSLVAASRLFGNAGTRVAILDEPTAALTADEIPRLFRAIRGLADQGVAVVYVSHRLGEVFDLCDNVTVLRDGQKVFEGSVAEQTEDTLVTHIMGPGKHVGDAKGESFFMNYEPPVLQVKRLRGPGVHDVSFDVRPGEIVGIAGLLGSGRTELAHLLFGLVRRTGGEVMVNGEALPLTSPAQAMRAGVALVPEDRSKGGFLSNTIAENLTIAELGRYWSGFRMRKGRERTFATRVVDEYGVRPPDPETLLGRLSGGNQQKVLLAKWITRAPKLLILDEPMQGIDVGAKAEVARIVTETALEGSGVIIIDSDFDNLCALCDRILTMRSGILTHVIESPRSRRDDVLSGVYTVEKEPSRP